MLKEHVCALNIERDELAEELVKMNDLLIKIGYEINLFVYLHLLDERVKSLAQKIKKNDKSLMFVWAVLFHTEASLVEANKVLNYSCKKLKEF